MECYIYIQSIKISFGNSNMMKGGSVKTFFMSPEQFQKVEIPCYCTGPFIWYLKKRKIINNLLKINKNILKFEFYHSRTDQYFMH